MTDKQHYKFIEDFSNDYLATDTGIKVIYNSSYIHYKPMRVNTKQEDVDYLSSRVDGATSFLYWLRRNGYEIVKKSK